MWIFQILENHSIFKKGGCCGQGLVLLVLLLPLHWLVLQYHSLVVTIQKERLDLFNKYFDIHGMSLFSKDDQTWILNSIQELYFIELWSEWFLKKHSLKDVWKWDWQIFVTEFCFPCFCNRLTLLFACFHWLGPQVSGTYSTGKEVLYVSFLQKFHKILLCDLLH